MSSGSRGIRRPRRRRRLRAHRLSSATTRTLALQLRVFRVEVRLRAARTRQEIRFSHHESTADDDVNAEPAAKAGSRYRIEALAKGLDVLRLFDESVDARSSCARSATAPASRCRPRSASSRRSKRAASSSDSPDGGIRPGVAVLTLGSAALRGSSLVQLSEQPLRHLAEAVRRDREPRRARRRPGALPRAAAQLGPRDREHPGRLDPARRLHVDGQAPARLPQSTTELRATLATHDFRRMPARTPRTRSTSSRERLAVIREQGYALQDEEVAAGLRSVSVPVFGRDPPARRGDQHRRRRRQRHDVASLRGPLLDAPARDRRRHLAAAALGLSTHEQARGIA